MRSEFTCSRGRNNVIAGGEFKHTFLAEQFATGLTDPTYNSPCLAQDGAPSANTSVRDPSQCSSFGLTPDPGFLPGLLSLDLTRGGALYAFRGRTDIKQVALFGQDFIRFGDLQLKLGLRYDKYNGLVLTHGVQPLLELLTDYRAFIRQCARTTPASFSHPIMKSDRGELERPWLSLRFLWCLVLQGPELEHATSSMSA